MSKRSLVALPLAVAILACAAEAPRDPLEIEPRPVWLSRDLEPLRQQFNATADRPRALALLAPGCTVCLQGALALRRHLEAEGRDVQRSVLLVWVEAFPIDAKGRPGKRVELFAGDPRITHYYDDRQLAAHAVAQALGWPPGTVAFDAYLFFSSGRVWENSLPPPEVWFHQRRGLSAVNYRTGAALDAAIGEAFAAGDKPVPDSETRSMSGTALSSN